MSKTSRNSLSSSAKRLSVLAASVVIAGVVLALPQTQQALPMSSRPVHAATMLLRPAARLLPGANDYWHTSGSQILDRQNHPVQISGVNWSGFETQEAVPGGLDAQDYRVILRTIQRNGFNTIRIPLSNEMVEMSTVPSHIRFQNAGGPINEDLRDLTSIEILDRIVASAGKIGLKVILDNHRSEAGSSAEGNGLWYTTQYPESAWIEDWSSLARRYEDQSAVIGMDLRNEPHNADHEGACWDCGGSRDWHLAAERAGNAVLAVNPRLLIFVEGVDSYGGDTSWWGGNLAGVRRSPVHLTVPERLVYSAHEYGPAEYNQSWFNASTSSASLMSLWRRRWAFVSEAGIAPVWIGEFGTTNNDADIHSTLPGSEGQWFSTLVDFLRARPDVGWTYWGINGEDHYGLLDANYSTAGASPEKIFALASISHRNNGTLYISDPESDSFRVKTPALSVVDPQPVAGFKPAPSVDGVSMSSIPQTAAPIRSDLAAIRQRARKAEPGLENAVATSIRQAVRNANLSLGSEVETQDR